MTDPALGSTLRCARKAGGMSVARTALLIGVSEATLKRWESGQGLPPHRDFEQILDRLGVPSQSPLRQVLDHRPCIDEASAGRPILRLLRAARRRGGLSLDDISKATGMSMATLHRYETGERIPAESKLRTLAAYSGCSPRETDLLVLSVAGSGLEDPELLSTRFESQGECPHFWVFNRLDRLRRAGKRDLEHMAPKNILEVLHGMTLMGDHQSLVEAWDELKPVARTLTWQPLEWTELRCTLLLARFNNSSWKFDPSYYETVRRDIARLPHSKEKLNVAGLLARVALNAGRAKEADEIFAQLDRHIASYPGLDHFCEINHLAADCYLTRSNANVATVEALLPKIQRTFLLYSAHVAMSFMHLCTGDRAGLQSQVERCRVFENQYGLGSPLVNRAMRQLSTAE